MKILDQFDSYIYEEEVAISGAKTLMLLLLVGIAALLFGLWEIGIGCLVFVAIFWIPTIIHDRMGERTTRTGHASGGEVIFGGIVTFGGIIAAVGLVWWCIMSLQ